MVNGKPFNAFANLVQAIEETCRYLEDNQKPGQEKVAIWADQGMLLTHPRFNDTRLMYE